MATHSQDAISSVELATAAARRGDYTTARHHWNDACSSMTAGKRAGEHKLHEYPEAMRLAMNLLDEFGKQLAIAHIEEHIEETKEAAAKVELARLRDFVETIQKS